MCMAFAAEGHVSVCGPAVAGNCLDVHRHGSADEIWGMATGEWARLC